MSDLVERLRARKEPTIEVDMHYPQIVDSDTPDAECLEAAARIEQLSEELEREKREAERAQDAHGVRFLNYLEETARLTDRIEQLEAEVQTWVNHTKTAVWSDSEECKMLTRINAALIEAPTVDIDVVVPDRDYSAMTPKDCYEAGLLDGVYQAREAIKAAARAALEGK